MAVRKPAEAAARGPGISLRPAVAVACVLAGMFSTPGRAADPAPVAAPVRIVPYSPALSAMAFEMGLGDRVVGVTRWARLPAGERRPVIGDAASVDVEGLLSVRPDVILVQGERIAGLDTLARLAPSVRVESVRIERLDEIAPAARRLAVLAGGGEAAEAAVLRFERTLADLRAAPTPAARPRVLFVLGTTRPTVAGPGTFIADLIGLCGGTNAGDDVPGRVLWRAADLETIARAAPDVIVCQAGEGISAEAARAWWMARELIPAARNGRVFAVAEPEWTIPSLHLATLAPRLKEMISQ
ncbi:MAG: hypothetical protein BWK77_00885 [Verrucomicrobia bacterium A1]|nr:MAG: hypothetical protein BWK77_00885 [Verrucomicrobia bacterium A1]